MKLRPAQNPAREEGFVLIEILVSAMVLTIASAGVIMLLQTTTRSQAELRNNSQAYALAQEDQARLTSMRLATLNRLDQTRTVTLNNTQFQVRSRGVFINDATSTPSCGEGTSSADYVEITSSVTWNGMDPGEKAKIVSVLSPSNGSLDPNHGTIAFSVKTQPQAPVPNMYIYGGSGAFTGYTDAYGCAVFTDLPAGDYNVSVSGEALKAVNKDGDYVQQEQISVVGGDTKTVNYEFDLEGQIAVSFSYWNASTGKLEGAKADSVVYRHTSLEGGAAQVFGSPGGTRQATLNVTKLFPFSSTYLVYAGSCSTNNPGSNAAAANVTAPRGGQAAVTLQLPVYEPTVMTGNNSTSPGSAFANADVWIRDPNCTNNGQPVTRRYTTNSQGKLPELGLPWGTYNICVDTETGGNSSGVRRQRFENVSVKNLAASVTQTIYLGSSASGIQSGSCS